jgi:hypothetical protein
MVRSKKLLVLQEAASLVGLTTCTHTHTHTETKKNSLANKEIMLNLVWQYIIGWLPSLLDRNP